MKKMLILNGSSYARAVEGLGVPSFDPTDFMNHPNEYSLVLFTGGEDVHPSLYNETSPRGLCCASLSRDKQEMAVFEFALRNKIPMTGICRGSQFLNVMNGGRMIHHMDGHTGIRHLFANRRDDKVFEVTTTHHQMSIPSKHGIIVGWCPEKRATIFIGDKDEPTQWAGPEVEALLYPRTRCFAVQYHPEYMDRNSEGYKWYRQAVKDLLEMDIYSFTQIYTGGERYGVSGDNKHRNAYHRQGAR